MIRIQGDALITTCYYNSADSENITLGGFSISDEMCVNYVHYFPRVDLEVCKSSISWNALNNYFKFVNEYDFSLQCQMLHAVHSFLKVGQSADESEQESF